jgi:predicted nuclease of restriction endonuclease-like (RecB) superfamily
MTLDHTQRNFIAEIKEKIRLAQYEALKAVNTNLIRLYWDIGRDISERQGESWGQAIVPVLSAELQKEFPGVSGFSERNLWLMAQFYTEYHDVEFLQPLVAEISWTKHIAILNKCKDNQERRFYILATKKFGWSKNVLIHQMENKTYEKYLLGQTNFGNSISNQLSPAIPAIIYTKMLYPPCAQAMPWRLRRRAKMQNNSNPAKKAFNAPNGPS